uniref:Uncharacterized protein n=2 Tax=Gopherus TaxID=38771 RepID=A0A452IZK7_9SAUR
CSLQNPGAVRAPAIHEGPAVITQVSQAAFLAGFRVCSTGTRRSPLQNCLPAPGPYRLGKRWGGSGPSLERVAAGRVLAGKQRGVCGEPGDMYYKFSGFSQKLVGAVASAAYVPQGLKPLASTESPTLIFGTPTKLASDSPAAVSYLGKNKVPDLQKLFQLQEETLNSVGGLVT